MGNPSACGRCPINMDSIEERNRLVVENQGLVGQVIKDCVHGIDGIGLYSYDDLYQTGCIGLIKAAQSYTEGKVKFSTYAYHCIRNEIYHALEYARLRRDRESVTDPISINPDISYSPSRFPELCAVLERAKASMTKSAAKGVDALMLRAKGYSSKEIGEIYHAPANHVTAWISKARRELRHNPELADFI